MAQASSPTKKPRKTAPKEKTLPDLPIDTKLPAPKWLENNRSLNGLLLTALEENKYFKRAIWPAPDDFGIGIKKSVAFRVLAKDIFSQLPPFAEYFVYKQTLSHYGKEVGNRISLLEKAYHKAKDIMGIIGGGLDSEEEISAGTGLMNKWKEAQKECPEFYRLKKLLGERTNVSSSAINNGGQSIDLTSVLPSHNRRAARSGSEDEAAMDMDAAAEEEEEDISFIRTQDGELTELIKTPIDRHNIALSIETLQHSKDYFEDLRFLVKNPDFVPDKTIVYAETIRLGYDIIYQLIQWYLDAGWTAREAKRLFRAYNSEMDKEELKNIASEFEKTNSKVRFLVVTDAVEMGIDNPDIRLVVQWLLPRIVYPLSNIWHRAGRVARASDLCGHFVWFVESNLIGPLPEDLSTSATKEQRTEAEWRASIPREQYTVINRPQRDCIRESILEHLGETKSITTTYPIGCCNHCDEISFMRTLAVQPKVSARVIPFTPPARSADVCKRLLTWGQGKCKEHYYGTDIADVAEANVFLDEKTAKKWADKADSILTIENFMELCTGWDPRWKNEYKYELYGIIKHQPVGIAVADNE